MGNWLSYKFRFIGRIFYPTNSIYFIDIIYYKIAADHAVMKPEIKTETAF